MGGCSSKDEQQVAQPPNPPPNSSNHTRRSRSSRYRPPEKDRRAPSHTGRPKTRAGTGSRSQFKPDTVHFSEFNDNEKSEVESILERNTELKHAEINFNDLKLQKIIGTGTFGEVIKGSYCGTPVVVKRMLRNKINEDNLKMFAEEIKLMLHLRHPNIVQFIGASWNSYSNICFITEFLERGDLFAVLKDPSNKLSWEEPILRMTVDTCRGMAYLHSMNPPIIHRDLKSMNILVSATFGAKVSDFGLSREKSIDETMSITGTPLWLPPEMIRGNRYSEKADVYSFGIVLSELDTRQIPYWDVKARGARNKKVTGSALMHMVAYEGLRPSLSPNCMESVKSLYERCTSDDPDARPTFEEIVYELENNVRLETLRRANEVRDPMENFKSSNTDETLRELGVYHSTNYLD